MVENSKVLIKQHFSCVYGYFRISFKLERNDIMHELLTERPDLFEPNNQMSFYLTLTKDSENSPTSISGEMNRFLYAF